MMALRGGRTHWYDIVLAVLTAAIVYPDKIFEWWGERTGRALGWLHLILIKAVAIALMIVAMVLLMPVYPKLTWWFPLLGVGMVAMMRAIMWWVRRMFGVDD